nr:CBM_HP1_G0018190.mRNA.1.CDS.1 [Saccharomyces cerevisiae]
MRLDETNWSNLKLPFLPIGTKFGGTILAESNAIWSFNMENGGTRNTLTSSNEAALEVSQNRQLL